MTDIHIKSEKLIKAVKCWPSLYNKNDPSYSWHNKEHKAKIWKDVGKTVYNDKWDQMTSTEKLECAHELQKRWKNLRTCFARELSLQKKDRRTSHDDDPGNSRKRKKYEYFDAMLFLLNPDEIASNDINNTSVLSPISDEDTYEDPLDNDIKLEVINQNSSKSSIDVAKIIERCEEPVTFFEIPEKDRTVEEKILDFLKDKKSEEEDADRQFMLSLMPCLKKFNDSQKFEAKIEILKVLKKISDQGTGNSEKN